jgi:peptidoglycan/xylan/chitin deacetylase (PgdA/CDA1 family)
VRDSIAALREQIFVFHGIGDPPDGASDGDRLVWLPVSWFEALLDAMPPDGVRITFDDGCASDAEIALPILLRKGVVADFFVLAGRLDAPGSLSTAQVLELQAAGMRIGSHGMHHVDWRTLPDAQLERELVDSRRLLSELAGREIKEAACPFGRYDRRVLRQARRAGYSRVYSTEYMISSGPRDWPSPRTSIGHTRPLEQWLELVAAGPAPAPGPVMRARRLVRRLR